jgi:hypothetical protein
MNKFDALKMFQAWPPEWQRLCAECWIETGEDRPVNPSDIEARIRNGEAVFFPFDQPKAAKVAAVNTRRRRQSISLPWSITESEYLLKLASEQWEQCHVVSMFLEKYPGRSPDAVRRRVWGVRSGRESSEVKY